MPKFPRFASPVPKEWRAYYRAIQGSGPIVDRPPDLLAPFRDGQPEGRKKLISLRVDEYLLELTKEVARQHQMRYQAVIRQWIQEGLCRAMREAKDDPDPSPAFRDR